MEKTVCNLVSKEEMGIRKEIISKMVEVMARHGASPLNDGSTEEMMEDVVGRCGKIFTTKFERTIRFVKHLNNKGGLFSWDKRFEIGIVGSTGRKFLEDSKHDDESAPVTVSDYKNLSRPEFEVILVLTQVLDCLQIRDYELKLNHVMLVKGILLELCGVPFHRLAEVCLSIVSSVSLEETKKELVNLFGLTMDTADRIANLFEEMVGSPLELLTKLKEEATKLGLEQKGSIFYPALNDLEILFDALQKAGCISKVVFDLRLPKGDDYRDGIYFEAFSKRPTPTKLAVGEADYFSHGPYAYPQVSLAVEFEPICRLLIEQQNHHLQFHRLSSFLLKQQCMVQKARQRQARLHRLRRLLLVF